MSGLAVVGLYWYSGLCYKTNRSSGACDLAGAMSGSLQDLDAGLFLEITEGLDGVAPVRGDDYILPFRRGRTLGNHVADARPIVLTGIVSDTQAAGLAGYRTSADRMKAMFSPTIGEGRLVVTLEDGTERYIRARAVNIMLGAADVAGWRKVSVELSALDPFWYGSWGHLTADNGLVAEPDSDVPYIKLRADASAEIVLTASGYVRGLAAGGNRDCEAVRAIFESTAPRAPITGVCGITVADSFVGFDILAPNLSPSDPSQWYMGYIIDNDRRLAQMNALASGYALAQSIRQYVTPNDANQAGEFFHLPSFATDILVTMPANVRCRLQFTPTFE